MEATSTTTAHTHTYHAGTHSHTDRTHTHTHVQAVLPERLCNRIQVKRCTSMWNRRTRAFCVDSEAMPQLPRKHHQCLMLAKVNQSLTPVSIHSLFTAYRLFTAYALPIHCLCTAYSLPIHCLFTDSYAESFFFPRHVWEFHLSADGSGEPARFRRTFSQRPVHNSSTAP